MDEWKRREVLRTMGLATMASAIPLTEVFAAKWPSRPITMIIATKAGGGVDGVARTVAPMLESRIKNATLNVVNKTGATGSIGGKYVFGKPADGHWMFCAGGFNRGLRALGLWDLTGTKDWQYFGADTSIASISVPIDSPIKSMEDLVKQAKDNPGKLRMSTNGLGGTWHLAAALIMSQSGTKFRVVPYKGGKPATTAALKKEVDVACSGLHEQLDAIKAGRLRNLCICNDKELSIQGQNLKPITDAVPKLKGKVPIGGGMSMAMRRDTDVGILKKISKEWLASINSKKFHEIDMKKPRFPDPVVGADADKRALLWETVAANLLADVGKAKKSPKDLGLPSIDEFENWWPPKGYKPRV